MLLHWTWLSQRSVNARELNSLLSHFADVEEIYFAAESDLRQVPELREKTMESLLDKSLAKSEEILTACYDKKINILTMYDGAYPSRLRNISDPPVLLYYKGTLPDFDAEPAIAVVGTRKASPYGMVVAKRMGYQIAQCGGLVVSGLAAGIDAMAMKGALTEGKPAVGVLGCGADVIYPLSNRTLYEDVAARGCLLTEFPPGTPPERFNFPQRNRIISGLACGILVVEAPERSGALITAQHALDQGRDVFAVPGNIDTPTCVGSNGLLRQGAIPVSCGWDVMEEYVEQFPGKVRRFQGGTSLGTYKSELGAYEKGDGAVAQTARKPERKNTDPIDRPAKKSYPVETKTKGLTPDENAVLAALSPGSLPVDEVIEQAQLPVPRVLAALTLLEVKGLIRKEPGKIYTLSV